MPLSKRNNTNGVNWPTVAVIAMIVASITVIGRAGPNNNGAAPSPAVVATIDLESAMNETGLAKRLNAELEALGKQLDARYQDLEEDLQVQAADLELHPPGSDARYEAEQAFLWTSGERNAYLEYATRKMDTERGRVLRKLYEQICAVVEKLAVDEGYDVVLVDDSIMTLPFLSTEEDMKRRISARRVLYANLQIDITNDVIAALP